MDSFFKTCLKMFLFNIFVSVFPVLVHKVGDLRVAKKSAKWDPYPPFIISRPFPCTISDIYVKLPASWLKEELEPSVMKYDLMVAFNGWKWNTTLLTSGLLTLMIMRMAMTVSQTLRCLWSMVTVDVTSRWLSEIGLALLTKLPKAMRPNSHEVSRTNLH